MLCDVCAMADVVVCGEHVATGSGTDIDRMTIMTSPYLSSIIVRQTTQMQIFISYNSFPTWEIFSLHFSSVQVGNFISSVVFIFSSCACGGTYYSTYLIHHMSSIPRQVSFHNKVWTASH